MRLRIWFLLLLLTSSVYAQQEIMRTSSRRGFLSTGLTFQMYKVDPYYHTQD
jgi:hypothetical protein